MLKHKYFIPMMAALLVMSACHKDDSPANDEPESMGETFTPTILYKSKAYVSSTISEDVKTALGYGILDISGAANADGVKLLVLSSLDDLSEDVLKTAYEKNKTIAVVNPKKSELDAFKESHEWINNMFTENVSDGLVLFAFSKSQSNDFIIDKPDLESQQENTATTFGKKTASQTYYVYFSTWLDMLNRQYEDNNSQNGQNSLIKPKEFNHTKSFHTDYEFAFEGSKNNPYILSGDASITIHYEIYMTHVFEGQEDAGDYYFVKMKASVANAGMWQGTFSKLYRGWWRWCGFWCTDFYAGAHLGTSSNWVSQAPVQFSSKYDPMPETTNGQTEYTDSKNFTLTASQTAGVEAGDEGVGAKVEAGLSQSWSWTHEEKRTINDADISNQRKEATAQWHMSFNNLPYLQSDLTYKIPVSQAFRNTMDMQATWLWYDPAGKDNEVKEPYYLCSYMAADYAMSSFWGSQADETIGKVRFEDKRVFKLPKINNATAGEIVLKNTLDDDMVIFDVVVTDNSNGDVVKVIDGPIDNGEELSLGYYKDNGHTYFITFKARKHDGTVLKYRYKNLIIRVDRLGVKNLDASAEFEIAE